MDDVRELAERYKAEIVDRTRTQVTGIGSQSFRRAADLRTEADASNTSSNLSEEIITGFRDGTLLAELYERATAPDFVEQASFDPMSRPEMSNLLWAEQGRFRDAGSNEEFDYLLARREERMERAKLTASRGGVGALGTLIGGMLDVDLPIAFVPIGGQVYKGARLTRMLKSAAASGASAAAIETANQAVRGDGEWAGVPLAALTGMALGSLGGIRGPRIHDSLRQAQDELGSLGELGWENMSRARDVEQPDTPDAPEASEWVQADRAREVSETPDRSVTPVRPFEQAVEEVTQKYERPFERTPDGTEEVIDEFPDRNSTSFAEERASFFASKLDEFKKYGADIEDRARKIIRNVEEHARKTGADVDEAIQRAMGTIRDAADDAKRRVADGIDSFRRAFDVKEEDVVQSSAAEGARFSDGKWDVGYKDELVTGDGRPVEFATQKDAATWIVREGSKAEWQLFEISANDNGTFGVRVRNAKSEFNSTVGAMQAQAIADPFSELDEVQRRTIQAAEDWLTNGGNTALDDLDAGVGVEMARKFEDFMATNYWVQKVAPDYLRLFKSGSSVMQKLAYDLLESPTGLARNHRSAAILRETYHARIMGPMTEFNSVFQQWAKARGYKRWSRYMDDEKPRAEFNRAVIMELNRRRLTGNVSPAVSPSGRVGDVNVHVAADMIERADEVAYEIAVGRNGERAVDGFKDIEFKRGYIPQVWKPENIHRAITKLGEAKVRELIKKGYTQAHPGIQPRLADAMAKAVMRRMRARELDADDNLIGLLDQDGRAFLRKTLEDSGVKASEIKSILDSLTGKAEERGKAGFAKGRNEIDLTAEIDGVKVADLFETDINVIYGRYSRAMAGRAALARKGITNDAMRRHLIDTALEEQRINTMRGDTVNQITRDELEAVFSYFGSGPINAEVSRVNRRIRMITNLALLNQLGLTQMAETGMMIWSAGIENFFNSFSLGKEIAALRQRGEYHPVLKEFEAFGGKVGEEHLLFRDELALDETRDPNGAQGFFGKLDKFLMRGQRIQGYTSLFFKARQMQQRLAVISMSNKVARLFTDRLQPNELHKVFTSDDPIAMAHSQLKNLGISGRRKQRIREAIQKHAQFDARGHLVRLNMERWGTTTAEDFALAMNRHSAQVVQKALAGEENIWWHSEMGSFLTQLKRFPLLAMSKQVARLGRLNPGHGEVATALGLSMATAGLTVMIKEELNNIGTDREFDEGFWFEVGRGALAYSNLTGIIPMAVDPMAAILGLEDYRFYNYGPPGQASAIPAPPSFDVLNRLAKTPGALLSAGQAAGDAFAPGIGDGQNALANMSNSDVNVLKTIPLVGNAYGMSAMWNWTKEGIKSDRAADRALQRSRAAPAEPEPDPVLETLGSNGVFGRRDDTSE